MVKQKKTLAAVFFETLFFSKPGALSCFLGVCGHITDI